MSDNIKEAAEDFIALIDQSNTVELYRSNIGKGCNLKTQKEFLTLKASLKPSREEVASYLQAIEGENFVTKKDRKMHKLAAEYLREDK